MSLRDIEPRSVWVIACVSCPDVYSVWRTQELADEEAKRLKSLMGNRDVLIVRTEEATCRQFCKGAGVVEWSLNQVLRDSLF